MSEVRVKVTADNQVKTGLQSALSDAKKFGQEASKALAPSATGGQAGASGGEFRKVLKGLGADLSQATTPAEAFQAVATRIAGAFGKVTAVVGGFAIGQIAAAQFDKLSQGVAATTKTLEDFSTNFAAAANATSFEGAVAGFDKLNQSAATAQSTLAALQSDLGAVIANALTGGQAFAEMGAAIESMKRGAAAALSSSSALLLKQAEERASVFESGGSMALGELELKQKREREIEALRNRRAGETNPNTQIALDNAIEDARRRFAAEDRIRLTGAKNASASAQESRLNADRTPEQRLSREVELMEELIAKQKQFANAAALAGADPTGGLTEAAAKYYELQEQIEKSKERQLSLENEIKRENERIAEEGRKNQERAEKEAQKQEERKAGFNENTSLLEARAAKDKAREEEILRQQDFEKALEATGSVEDASRFADASAALRAQQSEKLVGSLGASSLQRIGFASNEFFDTRRKENPTEETKRAADAARQILDILKKGEPLVLPASS